MSKQTTYYLIGKGSTNLMKQESTGALFYLNVKGKWVRDNRLLSYLYGGSSSSIDTQPVTLHEAKAAAKRLYPDIEIDFND